VNPRTGNIILVGMMGAGKTTVGRLLASRLHKRFIDTDQEIEARTGVRIPVIFEVEGEAGFRKREAQVLDDITSQTNCVIATGGGVVTSPESRALLTQRGITIYLAASLHDLWLRTRHDRNRPLLQVRDPRARIAELLALRDPLYREVADIVIETGRPGAHRLVPEIVHVLHEDMRFAEFISNESGDGPKQPPHTPHETY